MRVSIRSKIIGLVDDGILDAEATLQSILQWMSEADIQDMVDNQPDWDGLGLGTDDDDGDDDDE